MSSPLSRAGAAWIQTKPIPGYVFTQADGGPTHPHAISQSFNRSVARADVPRIRLHDVRHTHATLLIKAGVPVKSSANASATLTQPSRSRPTSTCSPACRPTPHTDAAQLLEDLVAGSGRSQTVKHPGQHTADQGKMVAGAGFEPATFGL